MQEIPPALFDVHALALPRGHAFGYQPPVGAWQDARGLSCGVLTRDVHTGAPGLLVMRRRVDSVWVVIAREDGLASEDAALARLEALMKIGEPAEPLPPNTAPRPPLHDLQGRTPSSSFDLLRASTHHPAAWILNQLYLALPRPDPNWASDCQTGNFHTRLWEAQLLAAFREQGLLVTQPVESPDFRIENRRGAEAWVEAVTANPAVPYDHVNAPLSQAPADTEGVFFGPAALRFAKTLRSKLQRNYADLPHVRGKPFALALADFQAGASMTWSRQGLIGYLYGVGAARGEVDGKPTAIPVYATHLQGTDFRAGLFADDRQADLSAVIFSNACSIAKLNRVMVSALGAPPGLRYIRWGQFFDRAPGAVDGIPFCLDVAGEAYRSLWPQGYEPWSAELEVFHNPHARYPLPFDMVPDATHWFEQDGEQVCRAVFPYEILWSQTIIGDADKPMLTVEDLFRRRDDGPFPERDP